MFDGGESGREALALEDLADRGGFVLDRQVDEHVTHNTAIDAPLFEVPGDPQSAAALDAAGHADERFGDTSIVEETFSREIGEHRSDVGLWYAAVEKFLPEFLGRVVAPRE